MAEYDAFGYALTPVTAQRRHVEQEHDRNTGETSDWRTCTTIACQMARRNIGEERCPHCSGTGRVVVLPEEVAI